MSHGDVISLLAAEGQSVSWADPLVIVTLALVVVTFVLAWATRSIARASSQEIRALTRPMLLPAPDADQRVTTSQHQQAHAEPLTLVHIPLRNAGNGPALNIAMAVESSSVSPWQGMEFLSAIAAGDETEVRVPVFAQASPTGTPQFVTFYAEYHDLAGSLYATKMSVNLAPTGVQRTVDNVSLLEGKAFFRPIFPPLKPNLTRYRRPPLRPRLRNSMGALFLEPGEFITPLRPRLKAAWRAIRPARRQTISQRLR